MQSLGKERNRGGSRNASQPPPPSPPPVLMEPLLAPFPLLSVSHYYCWVSNVTILRE